MGILYKGDSMPSLPQHLLDEIVRQAWAFAESAKIESVNTKELVFDIFVNGEYKRTFVNDVQINEFMKRIWNQDKMSRIEIVPVEREYEEVSR